MTETSLSHVITANDLKDGLVVYQSEAQGWASSVQSAERIEDADLLEAGLSRAQIAETGNIVVGVYAIEVEVNENEVRPVKYRERIRAFGPSTHPEFSAHTDVRPSR
jgi:hypothetical protein